MTPLPTTGFQPLIPYIIVRDAAEAIAFYKKAFGAVEMLRLDGPDGKVAHAELKIGPTTLMLADEHPEHGFRCPTTLGGSPVGLVMYVDRCDAVAACAVAAGIRIKAPIRDQFYGDRSGTFEDPFGHIWTIATRQEEVSPAEMQRRFAALQSPQK